ncbi:MAG TPA: class I SAM-dependent methyltransferase [Patescibacteria group bacterium]|nr:class I SAM-dependent methyltransferase [Patescibacteria group bacterium]
MDTWRYYGITHADHVVCNPTSTERLDELIGLLDLEPGAIVWEAACGKAELLVRLAEQRRIRGTGVDLSPYEVPVARERVAARAPAASLAIVEGDAAAHPPELASVDLAVCLGASWIWGGHRGTLRALRRFVKPGGLVLVGEPYWRREPEPEYLAAADLAAGEFSTLHGNVAIAAEEGLALIYALPSRDEDWDRYESLQLRAAERWALAHPDDPDVDELLAQARRNSDAYLRCGRDTLGWSIYLFRAPG